MNDGGVSIERVICQQCQTTGVTSTVTRLGSMSTLLGFNTHYDEQGVFHSHDPNVRTTSYRCSNGHEWKDARKTPCPSCGDRSK